MSGTLHLAQAQSNQGPRGRKKDFPDAERLVKRLVAQELTLSFVPDAEQRLWRTVMRRKYQVTRNRVQLQNRLECLLEEAHIKVSSLVSDLLGASARRMLQALADGETNPATLAALGSRRLRATPDQLCDALGACTDLHPVYRRLLTLTLEELRVIEDAHRTTRSGNGGVAQPASASGATAGRGARARRGFRAADHRRSRADRRDYLRGGLSTTRDAAGPPTNDWRDRASSLSADLEDSAPGRPYEERGPAVAKHRAQRRAAKMIRELRSLGYRVELLPLQRAVPHDWERFSTLVRRVTEPSAAWTIGVPRR